MEQKQAVPGDRLELSFQVQDALWARIRELAPRALYDLIFSLDSLRHTTDVAGGWLAIGQEQRTAAAAADFEQSIARALSLLPPEEWPACTADVCPDLFLDLQTRLLPGQVHAAFEIHELRSVPR